MCGLRLLDSPRAQDISNSLWMSNLLAIWCASCLQSLTLSSVLSHTSSRLTQGSLPPTQYVFSDGKMDLERLKGLVRVVGKGRLVLDLSCRKKDGKYIIVTDRWQKFSDVALDEETLDTLSTYADEYLVHGVDVEGKRLGIDEELVRLLGQCSPIPVTYAGGATTLADLDSIKAAGAGSVDVTVGSALDIFGGNLSYKDVVAWHQSQLIDLQ